jgi:uncharacterized membrane protein
MIIRKQGPGSILKKALGNDLKGNLSGVAYLMAIIAAFWVPVVSVVIYALVALVWIIPDRRFERVLAEAEGGE